MSEKNILKMMLFLFQFCCKSFSYRRSLVVVSYGDQMWGQLIWNNIISIIIVSAIYMGGLFILRVNLYLLNYHKTRSVFKVKLIK